MNLSPLLTVRDLSIRYGRSRHGDLALDSVSLTVRHGETVAIVGESGSGKSTLAHALLGLLPEAASIVKGTIELDGTPVHGLSDSRWTKLRGRRISLVPQDPGSALNPLLTIRAQVTEALRLQGLLADATEAPLIVAALALAGVPDPGRILDLLPHELSGGYRQRVLLAMAMLGEPDLLIADEPTSALDVTVQKTILDRLQRIVGQGRSSLIMITHDLAVAAERADQIVVMRNGQVVETGEASDVVTRPTHDYTRLLLASTPVLSAHSHREPPTEAVAEPLLTVTDLRKTYASGRGAIEAVKGVSMTLDRGRTLGLVGSSGSGKSTVARMINQLVIPTSGEIMLREVTIAGAAPTRDRSLRRRVQLVSQDPYSSLDPRMTVAQIVAEPLRAFREGSPGTRRERVLDLLDEVALPRTLASRRPSSLSGGQRQRVAIARALALRPDLIVLDEPVSALDVVVQAQILRLLTSLQEELGLSYLLISHDLAVVSALADSISVMADGAVVEHGPTAQVIDSPVAPATRQLIAAVPHIPEPLARVTT